MRTHTRLSQRTYPSRSPTAWLAFGLALLVATVPSAPAGALVVLADDFSVASVNPDINLDLLGRQTGSAATVPWVEDPRSADPFTPEGWQTAITPSGGAGMLVLYASPHHGMSTPWVYQGKDAISAHTWAALDHNFIEHGYWCVEFGAVHGFATGSWYIDGWSGLSWGAAAPGEFVVGSGSGLIIRGGGLSGSMTLFDSGSPLGTVAVSPEARYRLLVEADPAYDGSGTASWSIWQRPSGAGDFSMLYSYARPTGYAGNYLTFQVNTNIWAVPPDPFVPHDRAFGITDLRISTVPEPASLLWLVGGAWLLRRKR